MIPTLILFHYHFSSSLNGEGNGTPLQYSCLENPMDGGAWKAAVHGVAEGRTWLSDFTFTHWRRKWKLTPVFLPGESQGREAWWAAVYGVTQSRTRLKWLSSSKFFKDSEYHMGSQKETILANVFWPWTRTHLISSFTSPNIDGNLSILFTNILNSNIKYLEVWSIRKKKKGDLLNFNYFEINFMNFTPKGFYLL